MTGMSTASAMARQAAATHPGRSISDAPKHPAPATLSLGQPQLMLISSYLGGTDYFIMVAALLEAHDVVSISWVSALGKDDQEDRLPIQASTAHEVWLHIL